MMTACASTKNATNPVKSKTPFLTDVINVTGGDIQGIVNAEGDVEIFAGVPFAAPPAAPQAPPPRHFRSPPLRQEPLRGTVTGTSAMPGAG